MGGAAVDILIPNFEDLGAQRVAINAANGLAGRGHSVRVVVLRDQGPFRLWLRDDIEVVSLETLIWDLPKLRVLLWLPAYGRLVSRGRPRIVLSYSPITNLVAMTARLRFPSRLRVVVQEHAFQSVALTERSSTPLWFHWVYRLALIPLYRRADLFLTIARAIARDFVSTFRIPSERVVVVPNPIDVPAISKKAAELVRGLDADSQVQHLIGVGRLVEQKNFAFLVSVLAILRRQGRDVELRILGAGPQEGALKALAADLGVEHAVHFAGFQSNPYAWMACSTVFCLTSNWEGLPQVLAEAMICGVPVVARACPSGPDEMIDDGVDGVLVDMYADENGFAAAVARLLDDPALRHALTDAAARRAADQYGLDRFLDAYEALFRQLEAGFP